MSARSYALLQRKPPTLPIEVIRGSDEHNSLRIRSSFVFLRDILRQNDSLNFLKSLFFASCASSEYSPIGRLNCSITDAP